MRERGVKSFPKKNQNREDELRAVCTTACVYVLHARRQGKLALPRPKFPRPKLEQNGQSEEAAPLPTSPFGCAFWASHWEKREST